MGSGGNSRAGCPPKPSFPGRAAKKDTKDAKDNKDKGGSPEPHLSLVTLVSLVSLSALGPGQNTSQYPPITTDASENEASSAW